MSITVATFVVCDGCSVTFKGASGAEGARREARRKARRIGWTYLRRKDYCAYCAARLTVPNDLHPYTPRS